MTRRRGELASESTSIHHRDFQGWDDEMDGWMGLKESTHPPSSHQHPRRGELEAEFTYV